MHFQRFGTSYHPVLRSAADLKEACTLDEALWVATSAPINAFRVDAVFLDYLDHDKDQRVKCGELVDAIDWIHAVLRDFDRFDARDGQVRSSDLTAHADAEDIRKVLEKIGGNTGGATLEDIRRCRKDLEARPVSEAGVVLPDAAEDSDLRGRIEDMLRVTPGADHPSGQKGMDGLTLQEFLTKAAARLAWRERTAATDEMGRSQILPLEEETPAAHQALNAIRHKVEHFFKLCDVVDLDPGQTPRIWPGVAPDTDWKSDDSLRRAMREAPLAKPNAERVLKFNEQVNPVWERELHDFRQRVVVPLLDRTDEVMTPEIWRTICERLQPYADWLAAEAAPELAPLPDDRLRELMDEDKVNQLQDLIATQSDGVLSLKQVHLAEKLSLYQAHLLNFANNFIAFPFLYEAKERAGFEMGTLIMDGRRFTLSVKVPNRAAYLKGIEGGTMFIMIVELVHTRRGEKMEVAVPATAGHQGNLKVGKHGVFQHVDGSQWFATVVHIADNPISLGEAMWEPFKRLGAAVTKKVETMTQAAEKKLDQTGAEIVPGAAPAAPPAPAPAGAPSGGNLLAGGGIAIAALGSSLAFITKIFAGLEPAGILKGLLVAVLAVLIPSSLIAWLRLSRRDLSVLLEGADWAINSRMRLNYAQCRTFTRKPRYPEDSRLLRGREWWLWRILWAVLLLYLLLQL